MNFTWWIPQLRDEVLIEVISHAMVAKDVKLNEKERVEYVVALADFA